MTSRGHCLHLYLHDEIELALIEVQSKFKLGRTFAGQLAVIEGLYNIGTLTEEAYVFFKNRYSTPLLERPRKDLPPVRMIVKPTLEQIRAKTRIEELEKQYGNALEQWPTMKERSKKWFLDHATKDLEEFPDLQNAKLLLDLANPHFGEVPQ